MRERRQIDRQRSPWGRLGLLAALFVGLFLAAGTIWAAFAYASLTSELPSIEKLPVLLEPPDGLYREPTRLYDRSGEHVLLELRNPASAGSRYLWYSPETVLSGYPDPAVPAGESDFCHPGSLRPGLLEPPRFPYRRRVGRQRPQPGRAVSLQPAAQG
jgi:hypothetical protein